MDTALLGIDEDEALTRIDKKGADVQNKMCAVAHLT
jgi:hypothetical protein